MYEKWQGMRKQLGVQRYYILNAILPYIWLNASAMAACMRILLRGGH